MGRGKRVEGVLNDLPEPTEQQVIVCVIGIPGGNLVNARDAADQVYECRIPSKYRNVMWIKMGDSRAPSTDNGCSWPLRRS